MQALREQKCPPVPNCYICSRLQRSGNDFLVTLRPDKSMKSNGCNAGTGLDMEMRPTGKPFTDP
jgi:hypothetical protein